MKLIKNMRRAWARASIVTVMPAVAFATGMVLTLSLTVIYNFSAYQGYKEQGARHVRALQSRLASDLAAGETLSIQETLRVFASRSAEVSNIQGDLLASTMDPDHLKHADLYPIVYQGDRIGTLNMASPRAFQPLIPYGLSLLICLFISLGVAFVMRVFAKLASSYISHVTAIVEDFSVKSSGKYRNSKLLFSEFRRLNVATIRTTRRSLREIKALQDRAQYDVRTGLLNEFSLYKRIETAIKTCNYNAPAALIVIEFNDYERIAEEIGRVHSDQIVRAIIAILKDVLRKGEAARGLPAGTWALASLQSEQFGLLVQGFGVRDDLATLIREIQSTFRAPVKVGARNVSVSMSGSIVMIPEDGDTLALVRHRADAAILDMKRQGKKGFCFYSPKLERQRTANKKLESELRQAVDENRFVPLFQPKVDLATGRICGTEALARLQLDNGRVVSPSVFIDLAEETGLINAIGEQIMRKACKEAVQWNQGGHRIDLAVNVSPRQFEREGLTETVLDAIAKSGLSPRNLEIEITESLAIEHPDRVRAVLKPLRKLGIKLAIDDFGTGHSNLATLTQLDFDVFKIDRQFVTGTPHDPSANAIVEMILSMAQTLGMVIVGEGIETAAQANYLTRQKCHIGQGFLYSPPITANAFTDLLRRQPFVTKKLIA